MIITTQSWTSPIPRRKGKPRPQDLRANPYFKPEKGQPSPRERSPTPSPRVGRACLSIQTFVIIIIIIMSLPILPKGVGSGLTRPLLFSQAWPSPSGSGLAPPLPFLLAGPLAFPFSPFWLGLAFPSFGSGPGQPRPEGSTPTPRRKGQPSPREKRPTQEKEGPTPTQEKEGPTPTQRADSNPKCLIHMLFCVHDD